VEPVNIDFIIGGNVDDQAPKTKKALDGVADAGKAAIEQTQQRIRDTKSNIAQVEADLKKLQKSYEQAAPGRQRDFFGSELNAAKKALEEEKNILADLESKVNTTAGAHARLRTQVMNLKDELAKMEMAGQRGSEAYNKVATELGRLNDQMGDTSMQAKILADDQKGFRAVASGVSGLAGAMSAATGVAALMGAENEELTRIQTRLQAVMAITIGLQQVSETINKDSYFTTVLLVKAKTMWAAANLKVATTLGISTVAAKALMATLTLGLSVAITAIIILLDKVTTKNKEQRKAAEEAAKSQREAAKATAEEYGKELTKVEALRAALQSDNVTRNQKLAIIKKLKSIMPGYTAELDKEGRVIRENKQAIDEYMKSLDKSLRLKAAEKELEKIYAQLFEKQKLRITKPVSPADPYNIADNPNVFKNKNEYQGGVTINEEAASAINENVDTQINKLQKEADRIKDYIQKEGLLSLDIKVDEPKSEKETFNAAKAIRAQLLDINRQTSDLLFAQREENLQKTLDAIDREKESEISKIREKEQDIVDKYNQANKDKKGFKAATSIADIDPKLAAENQEAISRLQEAYNAKRKGEEKKYYDDINKLAAEAADSRVKIEHDYEQQIKQARSAGMENYAKLLEAERDKKISEATTATITELEAYKLATNDQLTISKETTEKLIEMIRQRVDAELAAGKITKENAQQILDSLDASNAGKDSSNNPFQNLIEGLKMYKKAKDDVALAKSGGASVEDIAKLEDAANKTLESTAQAAGVALQGVVNILSQAVDGLSELGLLSEEQEKSANEVIGMVTGAANLAMGIASGNPVQIIQGSIELLVNAFKLFDKKSKDIEKAQKQAKQNVEDLTRAYDKLQRSVDKALGTDVYKSQREQVANLQKQIAEYYRLIELEEQKKKKKQDQAAIAEWQSTIDELTGQIEDITDNIAESIAQTSVKDLASELADSLVSAFEQGADAAEAMGDVIDNVIKRAVVNSLKLRYLEKPLEGIIDAFAADMESGGGLSNAEADKFRKAIEALGTDFYAAFEQANQVLDGMFDGAKDANTQSGIRGDVANMTEQTGSALVGQLAAMRLNVAAILATSKNTGEAMTRIFATMERIRENTEYCRLLDRIDANIEYIRQNGTIVK
jgi:hypothetical protein